MQIKRMRIEHFSSFDDTGWIDFVSGINLIVGPNNVGKSALLKAFDEQVDENRHRDSNEFRRQRLRQSEIQFDIKVSGTEIEDVMLSWPGQFIWPILPNMTDVAAKEMISLFLSSPEHILELRRTRQNSFLAKNYPLHGQFVGQHSRGLFLDIQNGGIRFMNVANNATDTLAQRIPQLWSATVFSFKAQRYSIGKCDYGRQERLKSDASNLPAVLFAMQGEQRTLFSRLEAHLREIFSTVQGISVAPLQDSCEIRVWPTVDQSRPEFGFGLDDCGTGVAQVVAILTIAMTFESAVIVIDEISSFLHPAAVKALLRIIQTYYIHHQYIISTHSPEVLSVANPGTVHVIKREGFTSTVERVDLKNLDQLRDVANYLGVSMTDVFASERIIWVEGQTEELCFPFIYERTIGELPRGVTVTAVVATGDFGAKGTRRELVFQIYQRLSQASSPLLKSVTFSFDREALTDDQIAEVTRSASGRLLFLPRRNFECFLVHPEAIAEFIRGMVPELPNSISSTDVLTYLQRVGGEQRFKAAKEWNGDIHEESWLAKVDAASLIKETCSDLTEARLEFTKSRHSLDLLKSILKHNPYHLSILSNYIRDLFALAQS